MKENLFLSYHLCVFRVLSYQMKIVALHSWQETLKEYSK